MNLGKPLLDRLSFLDVGTGRTLPIAADWHPGLKRALYLALCNVERLYHFYDIISRRIWLQAFRESAILRRQLERVALQHGCTVPSL